ncbi:MAG: glutamate--tRNA ligase [Nitrospinae bacterium]|nr:glutamate--tRNA ligase [Nitrospinota bacterium]
MDKVRVRFAPSPTGSLHAGNLRTALFNWLHARKSGGEFILRIEDTDAARATPEAEAEALDSLKKLGLSWDEGPDIGGPHAPYRQSERFSIYTNAADRLFKNGAAYPCYCTPEELEAERKSLIARKIAPRYLGKCRSLPPELRKKLEDEGRKPSMRFKVERDLVEFLDGVRGQMSINTGDIGDFIIVRQDGSAAYNLAAAVDDVEMRITDVIRGEDHLSNTARQILIMRSLGAEHPRYHHLSIILDASGHKLSKREGSMNVAELIENGYLPEAILTSITMLGFGGISGAEALSLSELTDKFDIGKVSRSPAHFDPARLDHINIKALRGSPPGEIARALSPVLAKAGIGLSHFSRETLNRVMTAVAGTIHRPAEAADVAMQFVKRAAPDADAIKALSDEGTDAVVEALEGEMRKRGSLADRDYDAVIESVSKAAGAKGKKLFAPIRAAVTGRLAGPNLKDLFAVLGPRGIIDRIAESKKRT